MKRAVSTRLVEGRGRSTNDIEYFRILCETDRLRDAIQTFCFLSQQESPIPTDIVCCLLQRCAKEGNLSAGKQLHSQLCKGRIDTEAVVGDHLIRLFSSCGCLQEAHDAFLKVAKPTIYTWNAVISAHSKLGESKHALEFYHKMQCQGIHPDKFTFLPVLKACSSIETVIEGRMVHDLVCRGLYASDVSVGNALVDMYTKCGSLQEGHRVFDTLPNQDVVSWGAMIAGYAKHGQGLLALELFEKMKLKGLQPNRVLFSCALKACGVTTNVEHGRSLHDQILSSGLHLDVGMGNHLIDMYVKCGALEEGSRVLAIWPEKNVVSWGTLIAGYAQHEDGSMALKLFERMQQDEIKPDRVVFLSVLQACGNMKSLLYGRWIHDVIVRTGVAYDAIVGSILVDMYVKCDSLQEAQKVLNVSGFRDVVAWGAIIAGFVQFGQGLNALELFEKMQQDDIQPDSYIFSCTLKACGIVGALEQGRFIHDQIMRGTGKVDGVIESMLVDMYAKCGSLEEARETLHQLQTQDVVAWNAMIAGYAHHCQYKLAEHCFQDMQMCGIKPDSTTYVSVLAACSHAGKLEDGCWYFESMIKNNIKPSAEHFNCLIDLLGRTGHLSKAVEVLKAMPVPPNVTGWTSLLASCRKHGSLELGRKCFKKTSNIDPVNASGYILMSNLYADAGMWEDVQILRETRKGTSAWKKPGMAWIELSYKVHQFIAGGNNHLLTDILCGKFEASKEELELEGYIPQVDLVLQERPDDHYFWHS